MTTVTYPKVGIGWRWIHFDQLFNQPIEVDFIEIHPENFFGYGIEHQYLSQAVKQCPVSFHGVGLSLGTGLPLDKQHLQRLNELVIQYNPHFISEHLAFAATEKYHSNDLLPLPLNESTLNKIADAVDRLQQTLGRNILIENPSTYVAFSDDTYTEWDFLNALVDKTNCSLLLDINNVYVSAFNHGFDANVYLKHINHSVVKEIHLAGHRAITLNTGEKLLFDSHSTTVSDAVWTLFERHIGSFINAWVLIEWDQDIPALSILYEQAGKARKIMQALTCPEY